MSQDREKIDWSDDRWKEMLVNQRKLCGVRTRWRCWLNGLASNPG